MTKTLDTFRYMLEALGSGLGVADQVSGEAIVEVSYCKLLLLYCWPRKTPGDKSRLVSSCHPTSRYKTQLLNFLNSAQPLLWLLDRFGKSESEFSVIFSIS